MLVVRPISSDDYAALYHCAVESGYGFTSLPTNEELLRQRIERSEASFNKLNVTKPQDESYLMVGVDHLTGQVVGTTGIEAAVGWDMPFYSYHLSTHVHSSRRLGVNKVVRVLNLGNDYMGCSELCSLFLLPAYRQGLNGRLMSKSRLLMLAQFPERFSETIFAEMRGVSDSDGNSPFWQWLQQHFFSIDFTLADYLTGIGHKGFIADLMPKLPIYVNLLSEEAQAVIGQVHKQTQPALNLLTKEGFICRDYVDIFDAGPSVECDLNKIETVNRSIVSEVKISNKVALVNDAAQTMLISNTRFKEFRATMAEAVFDSERGYLFLTQLVADALLVGDGDKVRFILQN